MTIVPPFNRDRGIRPNQDHQPWLSSGSLPTTSPRIGIGRALHEVGADAADFGIEIRVEIHGPVTSLLDHFAKILQYADHPNVYACWNSNATDVQDGSIRKTFALVAPKVHEVHLHDLTDEAYPWRELFRLLRARNYDGFTLAEIPES